MKKVVQAGLLLLMVAGIFAFTTDRQPAAEGPDKPVKWYSWEEAMALMEKNPKKIFIDVYTDWCGWCKRMDANTFTDPQVAQYLNENFYPVKFNAEQKEDIEYKGHTLKYRPAGNRGVHELAYSLLDGRLGYPAFVYLDESQNRITISPGYKAADAMLKELKYIGGEHYKDTPFEDFTGK